MVAGPGATGGAGGRQDGAMHGQRSRLSTQAVHLATSLWRPTGILIEFSGRTTLQWPARRLAPLPRQPSIMIDVASCRCGLSRRASSRRHARQPPLPHQPSRPWAGCGTRSRPTRANDCSRRTSSPRSEPGVPPPPPLARPAACACRRCGPRPPALLMSAHQLYCETSASDRSLGQNFMLDDGVLSSIVEAAGVQPGDLVLEIGPGARQRRAEHSCCMRGYQAIDTALACSFG